MPVEPEDPDDEPLDVEPLPLEVEPVELEPLLLLEVEPLDVEPLLLLEVELLPLEVEPLPLEVEPLPPEVEPLEALVVAGALGWHSSAGPQGVLWSQASPRVPRWQMCPPLGPGTHANWSPAAASPQQSAAVVHGSPSPPHAAAASGATHWPAAQVRLPQQGLAPSQPSPRPRQRSVVPQLA